MKACQINNFNSIQNELESERLCRVLFCIISVDFGTDESCGSSPLSHNEDGLWSLLLCASDFLLVCGAISIVKATTATSGKIEVNMILKCN